MTEERASLDLDYDCAHRGYKRLYDINQEEGMKKTALAMALLCMSHTGWGAPPTVAVNYRGELVAEPCVIPPGEENIELDFGTVD
ncbi:hypothetical protein AK51_07440 [Serratia nematodiphila DZ0503SBS1]|nr:hypothetical protein AK51_07440 [Serratia nematodiphila DZ0503SBS1]